MSHDQNLYAGMVVYSILFVSLSQVHYKCGLNLFILINFFPKSIFNICASKKKNSQQEWGQTLSRNVKDFLFRVSKTLPQIQADLQLDLSLCEIFYLMTSDIVPFFSALPLP